VGLLGDKPIWLADFDFLHARFRNIPHTLARQLLEEITDLLGVRRYLPSLHDITVIVAKRDRDLPCVLIDSEVQHGWFSC
jgi:hypothetical protein